MNLKVTQQSQPVMKNKLVAWNKKKGKFVNKALITQLFQRAISLTGSRSFTDKVKASIDQALRDYTETLYAARSASPHRAKPLYQRLIALTNSSKTQALPTLNAQGVDQFLRTSFKQDQQRRISRVNDLIALETQLKKQVMTETEASNLARRIFSLAASNLKEADKQALHDKGEELSEKNSSLITSLASHCRGNMSKLEQLSKAANYFELEKISIYDEDKWLEEEQGARNTQNSAFAERAISEGTKLLARLQRFLDGKTSSVLQITSALKNLGYDPKAKSSKKEQKVYAAQALKLTNDWLSELEALSVSADYGFD